MFEQPVKTATAEAFEQAVQNYGDKYEEATSRAFYRGNASDIEDRYGELTAEKKAELYETLEADILGRIVSLQEALSHLQEAKSNLNGNAELVEYYRNFHKWAEDNRRREMFEKNPEAYTIHEIAVRLVMNEAETKAGKPWSKTTRYYEQLRVYATVNGLSVEDAETKIRMYVEARGLSYTVSTKNLRMRVA